MANQAGLRDSFLKKFPYLRYGLGEWREYNSGVWAPVNELYVKNHVQTVIQQKNGGKLTSSLVTAVTDLVKQRSYLSDRIFDYNPHILTFNDCCLNLIDFSIGPHSPDYYSTSKLSFDYDPKATSAAWNTAVLSFPYVAVLQQFAGLALTTETKYEIALWLYGPAGGGKSTFISGLEAMLGPRACVLGLDELSRSNFALSQIPGKTLAVSTEQPAGYVKCSHKLNAIISGEPTTVEQKFKQPFTIIPKIKLLWAMNELPTIPSGAGAGLFRRVYPIYWEGIAENQRDPNIKEEIMRSGMAVTNWALEGWKQLQKAGRFVMPDALTAARNAYREENDLILCFITDCCLVADDAEIASSALYELYEKWCIKNGHRTLASNRFAAEMKRLGFERIKRNIGNYWSGLEPKPSFDSFIIDSDDD